MSNDIEEDGTRQSDAEEEAEPDRHARARSSNDTIWPTVRVERNEDERRFVLGYN